MSFLCDTVYYFCFIFFFVVSRFAFRFQVTILNWLQIWRLINIPAMRGIIKCKILIQATKWRAESGQTRWNKLCRGLSKNCHRETGSDRFNRSVTTSSSKWPMYWANDSGKPRKLAYVSLLIQRRVSVVEASSSTSSTSSCNFHASFAFFFFTCLYFRPMIRYIIFTFKNSWHKFQLHWK